MSALGTLRGRNSDALFLGKVQFFLVSFIVGFHQEKGLAQLAIGGRDGFKRDFGCGRHEKSLRRHFVVDFFREAFICPG